MLGFGEVAELALPLGRRRDLLRWVDEHGGDGLKDSVRAAIGAHRDKLTGGV